MSAEPDLDLFGQVARTMSTGGHAALPGTGPDGETCGTCRYCYRHKPGNHVFFKCSHPAGSMTRGAATDIRKRHAACRYWEAV